jgi:hypothetical protein
MNATSPHSNCSIAKLTDIEAIRTRPGMYIGDPHTGPQLLLLEMLKFVPYPFTCEHLSMVEVVLHLEGPFSITFYEQVLPLDFLPEKNCYTPEYFYSSNEAAGRGLHYLNPAFANNVLSAWIELTVCDGTRRYQQRFERGIALPPKITFEETELSYTKITFRPDPDIFPPLEENGCLAIYQRLEELSFLVPGLEIFLEDQHAKKVSHFYSPHGCLARMERLVQGRATIFTEAISMIDVVDGISIQLTLQWIDATEPRVEAYTNYTRNLDLGTHVMGLYAGLRQVFSLPNETIKKGLCAIVIVHLNQPMFHSQMCYKLVSGEAKSAVATLIQQRLPAILKQHPTETENLLQKISSLCKIKVAPPKKQRRLSLARKAAAKPETKPKALESLSELKDPQVNAAILQNPNTPLELLLKLGAKRPRLFWKNPIVPLLLLSDPAFLLTLPAKILRPLTKQKNVQVALLEQLREHPLTAVKALVLDCPFTPSWMLESMQQSQHYKDADSQVALFLHPNSTNELRQKLWPNLHREAQKKLAQDRRIPLRYIEQMLQEKTNEAEIASNPLLPVQYFAPFAKASAKLREGIARNPNTPPDILSRLASDPLFWVRKGAAKNPSTPKEIVDLLYRMGADHELVGSSEPPSQDETVSVEDLHWLSEQGSFARWLVWHHPNTPEILKKKCNKGKWFQVRQELLQRL